MSPRVEGLALRRWRSKNEKQSSQIHNPLSWEGKVSRGESCSQIANRAEKKNTSVPVMKSLIRRSSRQEKGEKGKETSLIRKGDGSKKKREKENFSPSLEKRKDAASSTSGKKKGL